LKDFDQMSDRVFELGRRFRVDVNAVGILRSKDGGQKSLELAEVVVAKDGKGQWCCTFCKANLIQKNKNMLSQLTYGNNYRNTHFLNEIVNTKKLKTNAPKPPQLFFLVISFSCQ
jgi:hypothetical protein